MNSSAASTSRSALVLTFDRLPIRLLGAYGSPVCQTPHLDRFASHACTFDLHHSDDLSQERTTHSWWNQPRFFESLGERDVESILITNRVPAEWEIAPSGFATTRFIEPGENSWNAIEDELREVRSARESGRSQLVWIHLAELGPVPIPSEDYLELYLDELAPHTELEEDEPESPTASQERRNEALDLVNETLELIQSESPGLRAHHLKTLAVLASARVSELDQFVGRVLTFWEEACEGCEHLSAVSADRGLSLSETQLTGRLDREMEACPIQESLAHLPLLMRTSSQSEPGRSSRLTTPADLPRTLLDWFGVPSEEAMYGASLLPTIRGGGSPLHEEILIEADGWIAVRTLDWLLLCNRELGIERLYAKPEDIWQILNVLPQNPEIADDLLSRLNSISK